MKVFHSGRRLRCAGVATVLGLAALTISASVAVNPGEAAINKAAIPPAAAAKKVVKKVVRTPFPVLTNSYARTLKSVAADLDEFWSAEMPKLYKKAYTPLSGYYAYTESALPPSCGGRRSTRYREIADNAFYCRIGDYIAFDDQSLFPEIYENFGEVGLATVLAHEMGHAIQARASVRLASVYAELQADCFSGAWLARVTGDKSPLVKLEAGSLDDAVQAILAFRDTPGIGAGTPGAHGNGFDRVNAFQIGFEEGTRRCAAFPTRLPIVTARNFTVGEAETGGDVPINSAIDITIETANEQFSANISGFPALTRVQGVEASELALVKACPSAVSVAEDFVVVCPADTDGLPLVAFDSARIERLYNATGDFGVSFGLVLGWAALAQQRLGLPTSGTSKAAELQAQCYAGSWAGVLNAQTVVGQTSLSPGDLDEALTTLIRLPGLTGAFERVKSVRNGFLNGFGACKA